MTGKTPFVERGMWLPFVLLVTCFAAWGVAANMTDPLVQVFSRIFSMSTLQASLVQFAYYGAYFLLALPAAFINRRFTYKTGLLTGLGMATLGAFLFYPASIAMTYGFFLVALFCLAGGLSILETSANPFVISMGPEANATRRLNLAQAFNPVGTNIGVLLSATLILPHLNPATDAERAAMAPEALDKIRHSELSAVMGPYVGFAVVLLVIWVLIAFKKMPARDEAVAHDAAEVHFAATLKRLLKNRHYAFGVLAQFFNVAAQTCTWTFTIQYVIGAIGGTEAQAGWYLQASLMVFLVARFVMVGAMAFIRPSGLLTLMAGLGVALCFFAAGNPGMAGIWAVVALSACLSLMFPTIYGIALEGLGEDTKFGAAGLVMAIAGGAVMPMIHGAVLDAYGPAVAYVVPGLCFGVVTLYGLFDLRAGRRAHARADAMR
ncbi:L-fucose:H+ symporter permease [Pseudooceanicola sp. CBS1P-1]|uniref:L-fucose:H+ symporter permease n=1 Tax=Pseudooceanicola albus TaxID=2692189 RepID=A0A6L7G3Z1_9RHOB|nr:MULTISPECIES: L-fucose:H+ symporter permease [Pseudooceanicola]MBT9385420.1 L-fucose:H+ symporter permease [Pseudooceanicola endophyticus]MXN18721.1 L-fucose:H+ symporter permease [Pseudooceanicola albus]